MLRTCIIFIHRQFVYFINNIDVLITHFNSFNNPSNHLSFPLPIKTHQQDFRKQERQSERYRLELEHLRADYDRLLLDDEELQRRWTEQTKALVALEKQHATLTQQMMTLEASHVALLRENKQLTHEKWQLGQTNAVLMSQLNALEDTV